MVFFWGAIVFWILAWSANIWIARQKERKLLNLFPPILFGGSVIFVWQASVVYFEVSPIILPPPSAIYYKFISSIPILWGDFVQTAIKGALSGYIIGCLVAFTVSLIADKFKFFERGVLPIGNFLAAMPIIGIAPILVMWYGYGWQSKAAVVAVMVFFPILVNTIQGMKMSDKIHRDLMQTYNASYLQTLFKLRLLTAMPFIFNGLKICTTLALIGAIVAEFFGSPIRGMGFRISTEAPRFALDMVWAEITVAAMAGSLFYGGVVLLEKWITFWHPSQR
ncbi:MAG: ABC transporter permease, partial [Planktomarina sp.]|jgi:NitT/TauT family transport system permease protein|nr:ABC transporter permease [Planktomarina sp.]MDS9932546.1 ABC transporter permease [Planktomarina sp.]|tara:strand:+ start:1681 stop:2517 length:837 start_codon:yes stop_codon:yes gene_type:complete